MIELSESQSVDVHMVPVRDKLNDGPMVPELKVKRSKNVVESLLPPVAVRFTITGAKKLNCGGVSTVATSIEMTTPSEAAVKPALDLQRALLSDSQNEY